MKRAAPVRGIAYLRVSSREQAEDGESIETQRKRLEAYCVAMNIELVDVVADEGVSAKSLERPGVQGVLARLRSGEADALLVTSLDRLTRSLRDWGDLVDTVFSERKGSLGKSIVSINEAVDTRTATGRVVLNVIMAFAQFERERGGERTRDVLRSLRKAGVWTGGFVPYGMRYGERDAESERLAIVPSEDEGRVFARIMELRAQGLGAVRIAARLGEEGYRARKGGKWHRTQVERVLVRARKAAA